MMKLHTYVFANTEKFAIEYARYQAIASAKNRHFSEKYKVL